LEERRKDLLSALEEAGDSQEHPRGGASSCPTARRRSQ
jgi:hypothetical protein